MKQNKVHSGILVFDLDGTLINSLPDIALHCNAVLEAYAFPVIEPDNYRDLVGWGLKRTLELCLSNKIEESLLNQIYSQLIERYTQSPVINTLAYEGIIPMISDLKSRDIRMIIHTNKLQQIAEQIVSNIFGENKFEAVIGKIPQRPSKPDPRPLIEYMVETKSQSALFIGDSRVDMKTAQAARSAARIEFAGVLWGFDKNGFTSEEELRYSFQRPVDLHTWLVEHLRGK